MNRFDKVRNIFFIISIVIFVASIISIFVFRLKLGIDFTGGTKYEVEFENLPDRKLVEEAASKTQNELVSIQQSGEKSYQIRFKPTTAENLKNLNKELESFKPKELNLEIIGPSVSEEITKQAFVSMGLALLAIIVYITWAFRKVPKPTTPLAFGISAVIALFHDVVITIGIYAILGKYFGAEVDTLFITAILTIFGFSVHDTIVTFDRARENLIRHPEKNFVNNLDNSVLQTIVRSLNTSLTVIFVLVALTIFGGESIRWFVVTLLIGVICGTYSSIFVATPILILFQKIRRS